MNLVGKDCCGFRGPPFPQKLFDAIDVPHAVIQWTDNGRAICVDAEHYERNVMKVHPGLVEISTFANFRRQMREYAFDWLYRPETREFEFSHPSFLRGRRDLLHAVLTRRKRRRKRGVASSVGTRLQSWPRRRSVISYAGATKTENARRRTCDPAGLSRDVGASKWLNELTDDEWWTHCAPAIMSGMNEVEDDVDAGGYRPIRNRVTYPLVFYCDDPGEEGSCRAVSTTSDGLWTHRVLAFDEL